MEEHGYEFMCEKCNYGTNTKYNFSRHLKSKNHLGLPKQILCRELVRYECHLCDYFTKFKGDYTDHMHTQKHKDAQEWANMNRLQRAYFYKKKERDLMRQHSRIVSKSARVNSHRISQLDEMRAIAKERRKINKMWEATILNILNTLRLGWAYLPSSAVARCWEIYRENVCLYKEKKDIKTFWRARPKNIILIEKNSPSQLPPPIKKCF